MRTLSIALLLVSCTSEKVIDSTPNSSPTITILSHSDNAAILEGFTETFRAQVSDDDNQFDELEVAWYIDDQVACDWSVATSAGESTCDLQFETDDTLVVAEVRDVRGGAGRDEVSISVTPTESPTAEIISPTSDGEYYTEQLITFQARIGDAEDPPEALTAVWSSNLDGDLSLETSPDTNGNISDAGYLSVGEHFIELSVEDSTGKISTVSTTIDVAIGMPPEIVIESPVNGDVFQLGDSILFQATVSDNEDAPDLVALSWEDNFQGVFNTDPATSSGTAQFFETGLQAGQHTVIVTATDPDGLTSDAIVSFSINTSPEVDSLLITPSTPYTTDSLVATATGVDVDGDAVSLAYQWYVDGAATSHTTATVPDTDTTKNEVWTVRVTPNDGIVDGSFAEASVTIANSAPQLASGVQITPTLPSANDTLVCSGTATDADNETPTESYVWTNVTTGLAMGTSSSLDLTSFSLTTNDEISCELTVTDSDGATATASASVFIQNTAPVVSGVLIAPASPYNDDVVTCSATIGDPDGDPTVDVYTWTDASGTTIASGSATLDLATTSLMPSDSLTCEVSATDPLGLSGSAQSSVVIDNRSPVIASVSISPSSANNDDTLTCSVSATDTDGQTPTESYQWLDAAGTVLGATSSLDLTTTSLMPSDVVICSVTVSDGIGNANDTDSLTLDNREPTVGSVAITPDPANISDTLTCTAASAVDPDGDAVSLSYEWDVDGTIQSTTASTFSGALARGNVVTCTVTPDDARGSTAGTPVSAAITIGNSAPVVTSFSLSPSNPLTGDDITAVYTTSDADADAVTVAVSWFLNGTLLPIIGNTFPASSHQKGDVISATATPDDTFTTGNPLPSSNNLTIGNTPPDAAVISVLPSSPIVALDDLLCEITQPATDADPADTISYTLSWTLNGGSYTGATATTTIAGDTVPATVTTVGETWECSVTPFDGTDSGPLATASVTIAPPFTGNGAWSSSTSAPSSSVHLIATMDVSNDRVLIYGGQEYYRLSEELYEYDFATTTWSQLSPTGVGPAPLRQHSGSYDLATERWFVFGGQTYYLLLDELYVLDATAGAENWEMWASSGSVPDARMGHVSVFDDLNNQLYVIGGQGYYGLLDDLWTLDVAASNMNNAVWTEETPSGTAPQRVGASGALDALYNAIYIVGGQEYYQIASDVSCYDISSQTWMTATLTGDALPEITNASMAWNDRIGGFILYGGQTYYNLNSSAYAIIPDGLCSAEVTEVNITAGSVPPLYGAYLVDNPNDQTMSLIAGQGFYQLYDAMHVFTP